MALSEPATMKQGRTSTEWHQSHAADASKSCFLNVFPFEIREMVLTYVLVSPFKPCNPYTAYPRTLVKAGATKAGEDEAVTTTASAVYVATDVLGSCKQLHAEGACIFYGRNTFSLEPGGGYDKSMNIEDDLTVRAQSFDSEYLSLIKHIYVKIDRLGDPGNAMVNSIQHSIWGLPHLQHLTVALVWTLRMHLNVKRHYKNELPSLLEQIRRAKPGLNVSVIKVAGKPSVEGIVDKNVWRATAATLIERGFQVL